MADEASDVEVREHDGALWIRLNRPDRRNAYDIGMAHTIIEALERATKLHAVVITGSGGSFCAGGALDQLDDPDPDLLRTLFHTSARMLQAVRDCPRPVFAAVDGAAAGGGNELVVACDLAIATPRATFGQTGPRVGSAPVLGATNHMAVQIGEKKAKELTLLCRRYSAQQALQMGLINEVVEEPAAGGDGVAALERRVGEWIDELKALSPLYLEISKVSSNLWWNTGQDSMSSGLAMLTQAVGSDDMREGARAFVEKRRPDFPPPGTGTRRS
ncbi:2-ketocyclohexanecarboxyl-CoA hydrolase [Prauserella aidingensis]|uniref:enoyl-CoA hydratase/isomerase family protein n=1 Tax=Prauserella aidingensis TaxID=387890 RepID=UPI0020A49818|nr:enoyl-CoA hydratase-related protein [Prauserella aidingensis]MCP2252614.1 2-ketocyclohexanecarboxyl-CoA hydrolase [Prauserella aidingensis]